VNNESHTEINVCTEKNDKWVNACRDSSNGNSLSENEFQSNEINANCLKSTDASVSLSSYRCFE
jgi:hypothetical protein